MSKVTIQFADDTTGKNADVEILPNGHAHKLSQLLKDTPLAADGYITSVQLLVGREGITLEVKDEGKVIATALGDGNNYESFARTALGELSVVATKD